MSSSSDDIFSVSYSTISGEALLERMLPHYTISDPIDCTLLSQGLNDTYLIKTVEGLRYILRIYRKEWRTLPEISYELDALQHLAHNGAPASTPIAAADGQIIRMIPAPEGNRYAVLFTHAAGRDLALDKHDAFHFGRALAMLHDATLQFRSSHARSPLDWEHLIDASLRELEPILVHRSSDWDFLRAFTDRLYRELIAFNPSDKGFCHGDAHEFNAAISGDTVTWFDLDCCGIGWRAYDLATFRWSARWREKEEEVRERFLDGYLEKRRMPEADLRAIPLFVGMRNVWLMGLHAGEVRRRGMIVMRDGYLDHHLSFLRSCEKDYLIGGSARQQQRAIPES